jgi:hypothetical protein
MDTGKTANQVVLNIFSYLGILGEVHLPIQVSNYESKRPLCLLTEDPRDVDSLLYLLNQFKDSKIFSVLKFKSMELPNYCIGIHPVQPYDTLDAITRFGTMNKFFTVLIIGGTVPDALQNAADVIVIPSNTVSVRDVEELDATLQDVKKFLRSHPDQLQMELDQLSTTKEAMEHPNDALYINFLLAIRLYCRWFRSCHTATEHDTLYQSLLDELSSVLQASEDYLEEFDVADIFIDLFSEYVETHPEVGFCHRKKVDDETLKQMQSDRLIAFDDLYYFISIALLNDICKPLQQQLGRDQLLRRLALHGLIKSRSGKYAQKTYFPNISTDSRNTRPCFIWIQKSYFEDLGCLLPEEGGCSNNDFREDFKTQLPDFTTRG